MSQDLIVWVALAVAFAVTELATVAFVALYLAIGSAVAAVLAGLGVDIAWQVLAFVITSVALMALTRPFLQRHLQSEAVPMNVDRMTGKSGTVTIPIDNAANTGQIRVGTEYWTARISDGSAVTVIPVESRVTVTRVEGVTAWVLLAPDNQ